MNEKRRKLIFHWAYLEWGGAQVYLMAIMKLAVREWDVIVCMPKNSSAEIIDNIRRIGVTVELLDFHLDLGPADTIRRRFERQLSRISCEYKTLMTLRRFDLPKSILHTEFAPWQSWVFYTVLSLWRANVFVTMHNAPTAPARWRKLLWKARMKFLSGLSGFHIFTSNSHTKTSIREFVRERFWHHVPVTYTCVNPEEIKDVIEHGVSPATLRERHDLNHEAFVVLCVGQFIDRKGRWVFLEAAKHLAYSHGDVYFVWVSPTLQTREETERIESYGLNDRFRLIASSTLGSTRQEVLSFFRAADVFALPSYVEGLPIALLEAMALGVPVVSTHVYAIPEAVIANETGLLIEPGDHVGLADAVVALKSDEELRLRLASAGSRFVMSNFDERVASRIAINEYERCFHQ
jgi:glycosyltransferase involved in cell wall biosynthesis